MWDWADPKAYLHDEIASDKRNPTVNPNGPVYGALEESADYFSVVDPKTHTASRVPLSPRDADTPTSGDQPPAAASPYWDEEAIWNSKTVSEYADTLAAHRTGVISVVLGYGLTLAAAIPLWSELNGLELAGALFAAFVGFALVAPFFATVCVVVMAAFGFPLSLIALLVARVLEHSELKRVVLVLSVVLLLVGFHFDWLAS
jgi:hypothetical protein